MRSPSSAAALFFSLLVISVFFLAHVSSHPTSQRRNSPAVSFGPEVPIAAGTYPRATRLADGSLLGALTTFPGGGQNQIVTVKSTDNGASWHPLGTVTTGVGDIDNPFVLQLPSGRVLCAFRNHFKDPNTQAITFRLTVCYSDDLGASWRFLSQPASDAGPVHGDWEPFMRMSAVSHGTIQLYYSRENAANDQDSLMRTSTDGGATWSTAKTISGSDVTARDGMLGVAQMPGGDARRLIAVFESKDTAPGALGLFTIDSVQSTDDGVTWGKRQRVYTPTGDRNNAGSPQIALVGRNLVVSFMTDEDSSLHNWPSGAGMKVVTSCDGNGWGAKATVSGQQSNWPGLLTLDDHSLLALYDHGGSKSRRITLT